MKIFVAGASGVVGRHLVPLLVASGHQVVATTRTPDKQESLRALGAEPVVMDGLDRSSVVSAVAAARPETIVHQMTALASMRDLKRFDAQFALTNRLRVEGTRHLAEAAAAAGVRTFVAQSFTGWPYERQGARVKTETDPLDRHPPHSMTETLRGIEQLEYTVSHTAGVNGIVLRYGSLYGPGTSISSTGEIVAFIRQRKFPIVGTGAGIWSFIHVDDAARATQLAIEHGIPGVYNIVDDDPAEVSEWLPALARAVGSKPPLHVPAWIARLALGEAGVSMMTKIRGSSNAKAKRAFGWQPEYASWRDGFRRGLGVTAMSSTPDHERTSTSSTRRRTGRDEEDVMIDVVTNTDVLIVGAGPVGLFLANECARRGLRWRLVEARASQSAQSKALAIFPRTLEILDMAGLVGPFLAAANRVTSVAVVSHGRTLAHMPFAPAESPYRFIAMVPQNVTERLLLEQLQGRGGTVEYETSFVSAVARDDDVSVVLDQKGRRLELTATFVVGCDGAHSAVRHLLNLPFAGAAYDHLFMLADVETNDVLPADQLQLCPSAFGPMAIFPMSATRRRIVATIEKAEGEIPSLALVREIVSRRAPTGFSAHALHWSSYFRVHHRQVAQMRIGRLFIAGDAAHIHSPFGGQGMNTGLHDVWNLAWKLDLVCRGHGNDPLLESYSAERRPVIQRVIETTDHLTKVMGTANRFAQGLRDAVIPLLSRLAPFQRAFVRRLAELDIAYRGSPIVEGRGDRYFDESLRGGRGIRSRFLLVFDAAADRTTTEAAAEFAHAFADVVDLRPTPSAPALTLVRPDGYVAFAARHTDGPGALKAVRSLLERQIRRDSESALVSSWRESSGRSRVALKRA